MCYATLSNTTRVTAQLLRISVSLSMCKGVLTALSYIITTLVFYLYSCVLSSPIIAYLTNRSFTMHLKLSKTQPKNCLAFVKSYVDKFKTYLGKQLYVFHTPSIMEISKIQTFVQNVLAKHKNPSTKCFGSFRKKTILLRIFN